MIEQQQLNECKKNGMDAMAWLKPIDGINESGTWKVEIQKDAVK